MKTINRMTIATLVVALLASVSLAGPTKKAPTCPVCKMTLSKKKDKTHTVAVKTKNGTYYCCAACKMPKPAVKKKK